MIFTETELQGAYAIELQMRNDERGFFARSWCRNEFEAHGLNARLVQCNISYNKKKGTLRGMHLQVSPHAEAKLVRCTHGAIYDVIIDLRPESTTFLKWIAVELSEKNRKMLYVPEYFAHGFITLCDDTEVFYSMGSFTHRKQPTVCAGMIHFFIFPGLKPSQSSQREIDLILTRISVNLKKCCSTRELIFKNNEINLICRES